MDIFCNKEYDDCVDELQNLMDTFIRDARAGSHVNFRGLQARKNSIKIRKSLKEFRKLSVENQKKISDLNKSTTVGSCCL